MSKRANTLTVVGSAPSVRSLSASSPSAGSPTARPALALVAACLGQLMVVLDISVVNVALPGIDRALGFSPSSLSWVVSAYTLAFAGLLLLGGRLADLIGHRRTMLGALALFGLASVLGGLAQSPGQLIAARAAQGVAAAVLSPVTLAVIMVNFPGGPERRRAIATWGMVATGGSALGVVLSGLLTEYLDWRWVLFVNVPFVLAAAGLAVVAVQPRSGQHRVRLDAVGAVLATASMTLLTYGCVHAGESNWGNAVTVSALLGAVVAGVAFVGRELRADAPLVRLPILRARPVWVASVVIALVGATTVAGFYFASLALQNVLGYDPVRTGLAFLPFCAGMALATLSSSRLVERLGARLVLTTGLAIGGFGLMLFARLDAGSGYGTFLLASVPASIGIGLSIAPTLSLGTSGAVPREAGMVSGLLNTSRQVGGSVALAVLVTVAGQATHRVRPGLCGLAHGYHAAFLLSGALLLVAAAVAVVGVPRETSPAPSFGPGAAPAAAPEPERQRAV